MGKHLTKTGIAGYGLLLAAASISVWSFSYARFTAQENGMASATVAAWGSGSSTIDINVSGLRPGDKKTYIFEVTNTENGVTSEVGQDYSIIVETTGNLPLDFALTYDNSNPDHQGLFVNTGENGTLTFNGRMAAVRGGRLPHSVSAIHTYTLAVSWPEDKAGTEYTDEIDLVTLTVSSEQTVPAIQE
ncbi:hypothetical protein [Enterocloster bolteae]|uniref:hypothetical protein n=1 Tax=Enterocloster bolteae TaxID=208479 RepID=UPI003AF1D442